MVAITASMGWHITPGQWRTCVTPNIIAWEHFKCARSSHSTVWRTKQWHISRGIVPHYYQRHCASDWRSEWLKLSLRKVTSDRSTCIPVHKNNQQSNFPGWSVTGMMEKVCEAQVIMPTSASYLGRASRSTFRCCVSFILFTLVAVITRPSIQCRFSIYLLDNHFICHGQKRHKTETKPMWWYDEHQSDEQRTPKRLSEIYGSLTVYVIK